VVLLAALTATVHAATVTLDPGTNTVSCPAGHRAAAAYTLDRNGLRVTCLTPTQAPTAVATAALSPTATPAPPSAHANCQTRPPLGAIEPQRPEWCFVPQAPAVTTHHVLPMGWIDAWEHGASHGRLGNVSDGYRAATVNDGSCDSIHFRHNNHWMADVMGDNGPYQTECGTWLRPDRSFTGPVVIEGEVAVPIAGTRSVGGLGDSWPEIVISTRPEHTETNPWGSPFRRNGTYLYEAFPGAWTFGCRLQQSRRPICALYNDGMGHAGGSDRQWEINQNGGDVTDEYGGDPSVPGLANVWKQCTSADDPDTVCRNLFRFELTPTRVRLFVNGVRYYEAGLIDAQLDNILSRPFYVYFGAIAYRISQDTIVRFHWDRVAVNP
jgi:hypothetical protein